MKKCIYHLPFLFLIIFAKAALCLNSVDSLEHALTIAVNDTSRVNILDKLFLEYEFQNDSKALNCLHRSLELSKKVGYKKGESEAYTYSGYFAEDKGKYKEALKFYFTALKIRFAEKDNKGIADSYNNIGVVCYEQGNYQEALYNHFRSLQIKQSFLSSDKKGLAASYNNIGVVYFVQGNYPEALKNYSVAFEIYKSIGYSVGIASSYNNLANVYSDQGNYPEALKNYFAVLKIYEATGDKTGLARAYNNIGTVYFNQGNFEPALKNYILGLEMRQALGDKKGIAGSYNNLGNIYNNKGDYAKALESHVASLKIHEEIGDKAGIADCYNSIALVYTNEAEKEKNESMKKIKLDMALKNDLASLKIREETSNKKGIAISDYHIGNVYLKKKQYNDARIFLDRAEALSMELGYKEYLKSTYSSFTQLDSATGNFKDAFYHHKMLTLYHDSLDNEETRKRTVQSQMTYDFEKKSAIAEAEHKKEMENQQVLADEKSRKQIIIIVFVVAGLLLVLAFAGFILRSLRITRKQKAIIEQQKALVERQKAIVESQKLKVEIHQKEIIDSIMYARRIQFSLLPAENYIHRILKRLNK